MKQLYAISICLSLIFSSCVSEVHTKYYSNGFIKEEYSMRSGKFIGQYKAFYDTGTPHAKGSFSNGVMVGLWEYYHPDGSVQSKQWYKNGTVTSIDYWDENGEHTVIDGTGIAIKHFPSGQVMSVMSYKDNVLHGNCETWFSNGVKSTEMNYEMGIPVGIWIYRNEDGEVIEKKYF